MITIISNPNKICGYRPNINSTLTIYKKDIPVQLWKMGYDGKVEEIDKFS